MTSLLARIGAFFVEPAKTAPASPETAPPADRRPPRFAPPSAASHVDPPSAAPHVDPPSAASHVVPAPHVDPPSAASHVVPPSAASHGDQPSAAPRAISSAPPWSSRAPVTAQESPPLPAASSTGEPAAEVSSAAVVGAPSVVVPVAASCAGELRARARAAAALLCVWRPGAPAVDPESPVPAAQSPAGATTPGARRLAARLAAHELPATACGRLAWLALEHDPAAAARQVQRCLAIAGAPVVLAVAGARPPAFEPFLAELDLVIAVLPADIDPALRELALATLRARERAVLPPLAPGPPRWAAMAGLARLRSLPRGTR